VLAGADAGAVERAWLRWQEQLLGPDQDPVVIVDGKTLHQALDLSLAEDRSRQKTVDP